MSSDKKDERMSYRDMYFTMAYQIGSKNEDGELTKLIRALSSLAREEFLKEEKDRMLLIDAINLVKKDSPDLDIDNEDILYAFAFDEAMSAKVSRWMSERESIEGIKRDEMTEEEYNDWVDSKEAEVTEALDECTIKMEDADEMHRMLYGDKELFQSLIESMHLATYSGYIRYDLFQD